MLRRSIERGITMSSSSAVGGETPHATGEFVCACSLCEHESSLAKTRPPPLHVGVIIKMTNDVIVVETTSSTLKCKISSTLRDEFLNVHGTDLRLNMAVQVQVVCKSSTQSSTEELAMQTTRYESSDDEEGENDGLEMSQALSIARSTVPILLIRGGNRAMFDIAKDLANAKDVQILWEYSGDTHFADVIHCLPAKDLISLSATASEGRFESVVNSLLMDGEIASYS
jgi:hypothetical protein